MVGYGDQLFVVTRANDARATVGVQADHTGHEPSCIPV
jgi:hypothetical protein